MFLEGTTIALILLVLIIVKGLTAKHIVALRQKKVEVENFGAPKRRASEGLCEAA